MAAEIHKSDVGTEIKVTIKDENNAIVNLSNVTAKKYIFKKPSGNMLEVTPVFYTDGTDGLLTYTMQSGQIDEVGIWRLQVYLEFGSGTVWRSDIGTFKVFPNLN